MYLLDEVLQTAKKHSGEHYINIKGTVRWVLHSI